MRNQLIAFLDTEIIHQTLAYRQTTSKTLSIYFDVLRNFFAIQISKIPLENLFSWYSWYLTHDRLLLTIVTVLPVVSLINFSTVFLSACITGCALTLRIRSCFLEVRENYRIWLVSRKYECWILVRCRSKSMTLKKSIFLTPPHPMSHFFIFDPGQVTNSELKTNWRCEF